MQYNDHILTKTCTTARHHLQVLSRSSHSVSNGKFPNFLVSLR